MKKEDQFPIRRAYDKPASGRVAVKVINHLGDEGMKVFRVKKEFA
jgi:adenine-specific DNA-methyltransferase